MGSREQVCSSHNLHKCLISVLTPKKLKAGQQENVASGFEAFWAPEKGHVFKLQLHGYEPVTWLASDACPDAMYPAPES